MSTPSFALVLDAPVGGELRYLYYGTGLSEDDLRQMNVQVRAIMLLILLMESDGPVNPLSVSDMPMG